MPGIYFETVCSWGQPFAVGLVVAVPAAQGGVAGVGEKKLQRRRSNVAVAEDHVEFALMASRCAPLLIQVTQRLASEKNSANNTVTDSHHLAWADHFRFAKWRKQFRLGNEAAMKAEGVGVVSSNAVTVVTVGSRCNVCRKM